MPLWNFDEETEMLFERLEQEGLLEDLPEGDDLDDYDGYSSARFAGLIDDEAEVGSGEWWPEDDIFTCPACFGSKSQIFDLCKHCFSVFGQESRLWPGWLKSQVDDNRRQKWALFQSSEGDREPSVEPGIMEEVLVEDRSYMIPEPNRFCPRG